MLISAFTKALLIHKLCLLTLKHCEVLTNMNKLWNNCIFINQH